jgi:hypothetical protein
MKAIREGQEEARSGKLEKPLIALLGDENSPSEALRESRAGRNFRCFARGQRNLFEIDAFGF